ncbi:MAG: hypothetical protein NTZ80_04055, partial [Patescibacteria group bacterium]|nr:hypothetical protein [Patescibacteria group bacterium]
EKLSQFTADITMGLNIGGGDNAPAWLSRGQYMKDADYYQQFFAGLATVSSEMIVYIDNHPQMTIKTAEGKAIYQKWLDLETLDVNHSALFQHQQELVDLRAALAGALRIYGLTERQVEEIMRIS